MSADRHQAQSGDGEKGFRERTHINGKRPDVRGLPVGEDVRREIEFHIRLRTEELIVEGWDPRKAREEAERLFGDTRQIRRECEQITKEKDRLALLNLFLQGISLDVRFALRTLIRTPFFTAAALLSLAIGIGASTAIFSIVNGILLKPLPYHEPDRLVQVWRYQTFSKSLLVSFREGTTAFDGLCAYSTESYALTGTDEATDVLGANVTSNYFDVIGVQPFLGRGFLDDEGEPGSEECVILSYPFWQSRFGGDPGILGEAIQLGGSGVNSRTVVGVMPPDYRPFDESWMLWTATKIDPGIFSDYAGTARFGVIGRLADGVSVDQASDDVHRLATILHEDQSWLREELVAVAGVTPLHESMVEVAKTPLLVFLAAVGLVLLLTCANLANILLARAGQRTREMAVRLALGAARSRLIRQVVTENIVLGLAGGAVGMVMGIWLLSILKGNLPPGTPRVGEIGIDLNVLLFTLIISVGVAILYGLAPAFSSTRRSVHAALSEGRSGFSFAARKLRLNMVLVAAEIAISVLLLTGAGLLIRSTMSLRRVEPGFDVEDIATMRLNPPGLVYPDSASVYQYYSRVTELIKGMPGVEAVTRINYLPLTTSSLGMLYEAEGHPVPEGEGLPGASVRAIGDDYLKTLGIPLLAGPGFTGARPEGTPIEILVNHSLADMYWPEGEAVGKYIDMNSERWTIVGVIGDIHQHRLDQPPNPEIYIHHGLWPSRTMYILVRTGADARDMLPGLVERVRSVDADVPVSYIRTLDEVRRRSTAQARTITGLLTFFGIMAFVLGVIGVFGVVSYTTQQRTIEIGIRRTLGAPRPTIISEIIRKALLPVAVGMAIGLGLALAATSAITSLLFGVAPTDPITYMSVIVLQIVVALAACYIPAWRISNTDPMTVLREE